MVYGQSTYHDCLSHDGMCGDETTLRDIVTGYHLHGATGGDVGEEVDVPVASGPGGPLVLSEVVLRPRLLGEGTPGGPGRSGKGGRGTGGSHAGGAGSATGPAGWRRYEPRPRCIDIHKKGQGVTWSVEGTGRGTKPQAGARPSLPQPSALVVKCGHSLPIPQQGLSSFYGSCRLTPVGGLG